MSKPKAFELLDAVDIYSILPKNFYENLKAQKSSDRKEALEVFLKLLADNPRLSQTSNYEEIVTKLTTVLKEDSNINVSSLAAKCLGCLANGIQEKFSQFAPSIISVIFDRFIEKKPVLKDALRECLDLVFSTTTLDAVVSDILTAAGTTNPSIKSQLHLFLYRVFKGLSPSKIPEGFLEDLMSFLIKHATDVDPAVSDSSFSALGAILMCVGDKVFNELAGTELLSDKAKMMKITEYMEKAKSESEFIASKESVETKLLNVSEDSQKNCQSKNVEEQANLSYRSSNTNAITTPFDSVDPVDIQLLIETNVIEGESSSPGSFLPPANSKKPIRVGIYGCDSTGTESSDAIKKYSRNTIRFASTSSISPTNFDIMKQILELKDDVENVNERLSYLKNDVNQLKGRFDNFVGVDEKDSISRVFERECGVILRKILSHRQFESNYKLMRTNWVQGEGPKIEELDIYSKPDVDHTALLFECTLTLSSVEKVYKCGRKKIALCKELNEDVKAYVYVMRVDQYQSLTSFLDAAEEAGVEIIIGLSNLIQCAEKLAVTPKSHPIIKL